LNGKKVKLLLCQSVTYKGVEVKYWELGIGWRWVAPELVWM